MNGNLPPHATACSICGTQHASDSCPAALGARVGAVLDGKYELVRLIGQGGMGEVYEGRHRVIGRRVAVKFLHGEYAQNPGVALRFENEARAAGGIEHENIAGIYDVGSLPDGTRYLVMEFLDGEDVDKLLRRDGPLPTARAAFIVIQACRALDVVHQRGIVHRDLKPSNLFLAKRADKTDLVKVIDFGIAKLKTSEAHSATKSGTAIGTAHYMSPEQARGERSVDTRSDVYSLGVILYELVSGKKPHEGDSLLQILHKVMTQSPVPLEAVRPGLPDGLYGIVRRAMAAQVLERYATVAELGDALLPFAGRALPPIRSPSAAFATPRADASETRASVASALNVATPVGPSMVAVVRSEPNAANRVRATRPRMTRARLVSGVVALLGLAGGLATVGSVFLKTSAKPVSPAAELAPVGATAAGSVPAAAESAQRTAVTMPPASAATPDAAVATASPANGVRLTGTQRPDSEHPRPNAPSPPSPPAAPFPGTQLSGQRTPASEHPAPQASSAAPIPTAVALPAEAPPSAATATTPPAPPKPTATDRSDNPF